MHVSGPKSSTAHAEDAAIKSPLSEYTLDSSMLKHNFLSKIGSLLIYGRLLLHLVNHVCCSRAVLFFTLNPLVRLDSRTSVSLWFTLKPLPLDASYKLSDPNISHSIAFRGNPLSRTQ